MNRGEEWLCRIPLVFEHFVRWGQSAELFLDELAKKSRTMEGPRTEKSFGWIKDHICLSSYRSATVRERLIDSPREPEVAKFSN